MTMKRQMTQSFVAVVLIMSAFVNVAHAQDVALPEPVTQPAKKGDSGESEPEIALDVDREIDLANVVTSAAKGVTTVQEAPAIITIITADEIRARGEKYVMDALATVPGWMDVSSLGTQVANPLVRGVSQAVLLLHDGISMFDPWGNITSIGREVSIENIKRIEVVTGPGGVLWGANSFMGIANLITKDAEDVNGLELSAGYGDGPGNKQDFKAYGLFGKTFLNGKLKFFQHISYESYIGPVYTIPQFVVSAPGPQPGGLAWFGPPLPTDPLRSWHVNLDGKYTFGPVSLYYSVPFGDTHPNLSFGQAVAGNDLWSSYDRYGVLEYRDRYLKDRIGLTVKAYGTQFVRDYAFQLFPPSNFFPPTKTSPGGLIATFAGQKIFRVGGTVDTDFNLPFNIRILVGGELFYEGLRGSNSTVIAPGDVNLVPLVCPVDANGIRVANCPRQYASDTGRYVTAGYVDAQYRPFQKLTLDGGVRLQAGFGDLPYSPQWLGSAAVVWNFLPDFHVKVNYATGFRAPVFQNTSVLQGGLSYGPNANLKTESSQSFQGELNARVLRNVRKVRELELRVDYSYSILKDVIQLRESVYGNTGDRAIHSVEGYAKLYLNGDHFLQASYTYLYAYASDVGVVRALPNHWVVLGGSFNIVKNLLDLNFNLRVFGASQDPNRYPGGPGGGVVYGPTLSTPATTTAQTSNLTFDRLTPVADLQLGFRLRFLKDKLQFSGQFYNVLNQHYYYPDNFYDLTPTVEQIANPGPAAFNFFANLSYHF
jgi:outer membrane receptor protein involved in Fe transport